jgi:hypothetical protein
MPTTIQKKIDLYDLLRKEGCSRNLAIALLANIEVETGGTFDHTIKQRGRTNPAYGLFQFDPIGGLYALYYEYLEEEGVRDSAKAQVEFIVDTLSTQYRKGVTQVGRGNINKVMTASRISPEAGAEAFCTFILRPGKPHLNRRIVAATQISKMFNG